MAPVTALVPSAYSGKGKLSGQRRYHPTRRLKDEKNHKNWNKFEGNVLDLSESMLEDLRPITMAPSFDRLTVLCLRRTDLVDIELLRSCTSLVYLDLSSNKVVQLVDDSFWACFPELLVLLLHGNKVCANAMVRNIAGLCVRKHCILPGTYVHNIVAVRLAFIINTVT